MSETILPEELHAKFDLFLGSFKLYKQNTFDDRKINNTNNDNVEKNALSRITVFLMPSKEITSSSSLKRMLFVKTSPTVTSHPYLKRTPNKTKYNKVWIIHKLLPQIHQEYISSTPEAMQGA